MAASWHRILLVSVLVVLAGVAVWGALSFPGYVNDLRAQAAGKSNGKKVQGIAPEEIAAQEEQWKNPPRWTAPESGNPLLTSRRFLYFTATKSVQLAKEDIELDGVPLKWLTQNGLDAGDPDILSKDNDGDGFNNREEYLLKTDARDPKSHPSYANLLRLKSSTAQDFHLVFSSVNDVGDDKVFQIGTPQGKKRSYSVKKGESFEGFTVVDYRPKRGAKKIGNLTVEDADISELELKNDATGAPVVLILREDQNVPAVSATFVLLLANAIDKPVTVAQGKEFTLDASPKADIPPETLHFQLLSVDAAGAKLVRPETKETIAVPPLKPEELQRFAAPTASPLPTSS